MVVSTAYRIIFCLIGGLNGGSRVCSLREPLWLRRRTGRGHHSLTQRFAKDLPHVINKNEANVLEWFFRNLVQIAPVLLRQDNCSHTCPPRRKNFFLYATDRQNVSSHRDLTGHRNVLANWSS